MIGFYRSAVVAQGRMREALAFAKEIAAYIEKKTGTTVGVGVPIGGAPNRIGWSAQYDDLASFEKTMGTLMADPEYMEMVADNGDHFLAGSIHDELWSTI